MDQQVYAQPQVAQPQFVVMPVAQRNGLGLFAFLLAFIGLFIPTGIVALLGLVLGLAAIGRAPRGFATGAVILGLLGSVFWLGVMIVAVVAGLLGAVAIAVCVAGAFVLMQPEVLEVTSDMVNVAIAAEEYQQEHGELPAELGVLTLSVAALMDPWGSEYQFVVTDDEPGFDIISGGPDREFETDDDVRMTRLDRYWEEAVEQLEHRMDEFGRRMERLQAGHHGRGACQTGINITTDYERDACRELFGGGSVLRLAAPTAAAAPIEPLEPVAPPAPPAQAERPAPPAQPASPAQPAQSAPPAPPAPAVPPASSAPLSPPV